MAEKAKANKMDWRDIFKQLIIIVIAGALGFLGSELVNLTRQGTIQLKATAATLNEHAVAEIYGSDDKLLHTAPFSQGQIEFSLPASAYTAKVRSGDKFIFEQNFSVKPRSTVVLQIKIYPPNYINVTLSANKNIYKPKDSFSVELQTDTDGYFWLYAIDPAGKFNELFPISGANYNFQNGILANQKRIVPNRVQDNGVQF